MPPTASPRPVPLRFLYACTALLVLVLLATNAAVIVHLHDSELGHEESELKNLSLTIAEQANRSLEAVDLVVSGAASELAALGVNDAESFARLMPTPEVHRLLREKITGVPQLAAVTVIGPDGKLVNFSRGWPVPEIDVTDRDYFRALRDDPSLQRYISVPSLNRVSKTWTIFLAHRINGPHGTFLGIIFGAIEMTYFEDFYRAIALDPGGTVTLQRLDGALLVRFPHDANALGKMLSTASHLLPDGVSGSVRESSPFDGRMRLKAAHIVSGFPILAMATKTEDAALANWRSIAQLLGLAALASALSIALAGIAFARQWRQQAMLAETRAELRHHAARTAAFEEMRAAKEAAEIADRTKSEFLATMSHELRTPLNAVLGFSEIMVNEVFGPLGNERYRGYAGDIHTSGSHLLSIINDVLDLSKAAAGKLELYESLVHAQDAIETVCRLIRPRVAELKLTLSVKLPPRLLTIRCDERLLKQILLNLLSNACKFTPPGGRIECTVSVTPSGIRFAVSDTGIGIPPEHLDRVVQPFVQVDSSLSRRHEGTGLGLSLVKAMAELHGGTLTLTSKVDIGTTAAVFLPLDRLLSMPDEIVANNAQDERAIA